MNSPLTSEELRPLVIESAMWPTFSIDPPDSDGDLCVDLGEEVCDLCNGTRTWLTKAEATALRDWLNKVLS